RCRTFEHAVSLRRLCEVSNLSGAAVVSDRRQQIILDHSTQRHVRTESLRRFESHLCELFRGVFPFALLRTVLSIRDTRHCMAAILGTVLLMEKERERIRGGEYLRVISGAHKLAAPLLDCCCDLSRATRGFGIERRCESLQLGVKWIEEDQTIAAEQRRHHHPETLGVAATRLPGALH